jgi:hypothetical protein
MASPERQEEHSEQAFTVSDKRLFTKEGQRREGEARAVPPRTSTPPPSPEPPRQAPPPPPQMEGPPPPLQEMPPADFTTFVAMLANNIMMFLGQIPDPMTQQRRVDPAQAKHSIDILMMLQEKTQGNLTTEEARLLEEILPQLQMAYVSVTRQRG